MIMIIIKKNQNNTIIFFAVVVTISITVTNFTATQSLIFNTLVSLPHIVTTPSLGPRAPGPRCSTGAQGIGGRRKAEEVGDGGGEGRSARANPSRLLAPPFLRWYLLVFRLPAALGAS